MKNPQEQEIVELRRQIRELKKENFNLKLNSSINPRQQWSCPRNSAATLRFIKKDNVAKSGMRRLFVGDVTIEMLPSGRDISARHCLDFRHSLHLWLLLLSENRSVAHLYARPLIPDFATLSLFLCNSKHTIFRGSLFSFTHWVKHKTEAKRRFHCLKRRFASSNCRI